MSLEYFMLLCLQQTLVVTFDLLCDSKAGYVVMVGKTESCPI